jgi:hypothetical protein
MLSFHLIFILSTSSLPARHLIIACLRKLSCITTTSTSVTSTSFSPLLRGCFVTMLHSLSESSVHKFNCAMLRWWGIIRKESGRENLVMFTIWLRISNSYFIFFYYEFNLPIKMLFVNSGSLICDPPHHVLLLSIVFSQIIIVCPFFNFFIWILILEFIL